VSEGAYAEPAGSEVESTDGWSGSPASHERAVMEQTLGTASRRRKQAVHQLGLAKERGLTWRDLADRLAMHHGQASGVLSVLHKEGRISCLLAKRNRCHIYVLHEYVNDRNTRPPGRTAVNKGLDYVDPVLLKYQLAAAVDEGFDLGLRVGHDTGWIEGRDAGRGGVLPEIEAAYHKGSDAGWQAGYDSAMGEVAAWPTETLVDDARQDGVRIGREAEALRMMKLVVTMRESIKKTQGNRVHNHSGVCWMENPACALDSMEKAIARSLPLPVRKVRE